jgi:short-subunit dehydrogenase
VEFIETDLATIDGVKELKRATDGRHVAVLAANAGHGLGHAFLEQDWDDVRHVIDTNITGLTLLVHHVGKAMRARGGGRILLTGSIAGTMPGTYQAVYNASKAFVNSFGEAVREEVKDSGITVTVLMPGATETEFFHRAGLDDTREGAKSKDSAEAVARTGWDAMKRGDNHEVHGLPNKIRATLNRWLPDSLVAKQHGRAMQPGGAREKSQAPAIGGVLAAAAAIGGIALAVRAAQQRSTEKTGYMNDLRDGRRHGRPSDAARYAD